MPILRTILAAVALVVIWTTGAAAADPLRLDPATPKIDMAGKWEMLRDPSGTLTIDDVRQPEHANRFAPLPGHLALGYTRDAIWLRAVLLRPPDVHDEWWLEAELPYLDHVDFYAPDADGRYAVQAQGDRRPFSARPIAHRNFLFRVGLDESKPQTVYLRIETRTAVTLKTYLWTLQAFTVAAPREALALGVLHGAMVLVLIFALIQYLATRDAIYLYYFAYASTTEVMFFLFNGYGGQFLLPDAPRLADQLVGVTACLSVGFGALFIDRLFDLPGRFTALSWFYRGLSLIAGLCVAIVMFDHYSFAVKINNASATVLLVTTPFIALVLALRGDRLAMTYMAAFLVYNVAQILVILRTMGVLDTPIEADWAIQLGSVLHIILLSMGLVQRIKTIEREREAVQARLLDTLRRSERELEERVNQRTHQLATTNLALADEIVERRNAETRLRDSERLVRDILDAAPFPMFVSKYPQGALLFLNQPAAELLGITPQTGIGRSVADFYDSPDQRPSILAEIETNGMILNREIRARRADGERRWLLISVVRFRYGAEDALLISANDISTSKRLEESLRDAHRQSETALAAERRAMREQRNFLAMVSHEFRSPLAIIEAAAQLLNLYLGEHNADAATEVDKIRRAVRRTSDLIDNCLSDDWLDSTMMSLRPSRVDLARLLAEIGDDKRPIAGTQRLVLDIGELPPIEADVTLLRVVFSNLLDNAIKYAPPPAPITVRATADEREITVSVIDQGPGIATDEQAAIFEKFFRSAASGRTPGAGLGLYIVKRIIDLHGARIELDSRPGTGSTFTVRLPLRPLPPAKDP